MNALDRQEKVVLLLTFALSLCFWCKHKPEVKQPPITPIPVIEVTTIQQTATHGIVFYGVDKATGNRKGLGLCSGTAIGPHAFLTATHCINDGNFAVVRFDLNPNDVEVTAIKTDGHDHAILLLRGVTFTNIAPYKARAAKIGERVTLWGVGGGHYPPRMVSGHAITPDDPSDVDQAVGINSFEFDGDTIPGDSGSAVWSDDGYILGLTTYGRQGKDHADWDFVMNFDSVDIATAQNYEPPKE